MPMAAPRYGRPLQITFTPVPETGQQQHIEKMWSTTRSFLQLQNTHGLLQSYRGTPIIDTVEQ